MSEILSEKQTYLLLSGLKDRVPLTIISYRIGISLKQLKFHMKKLGVANSRKKKFKEEDKRFFSERRIKINEEQEIENKNLIKSLHPYLNDKWEMVLFKTKARMINLKGQNVLFMDGKPASVKEIMNKYNKIIEQQNNLAKAAAGE